MNMGSFSTMLGRKKGIINIDNDINMHLYTVNIKSTDDNSAIDVIASAEKLPYKLPWSYSLDDEAAILKDIKNRNGVIQRVFVRKDYDAIENDWGRVGEYFNGGVRKAREQYGLIQ